MGSSHPCLCSKKTLEYYSVKLGLSSRRVWSIKNKGLDYRLPDYYHPHTGMTVEFVALHSGSPHPWLCGGCARGPVPSPHAHAQREADYMGALLA